MRTQLQRRLTELKNEFDAGQKALADLDQKRHALEQTLLRISGAIQVLEEELAKSEQPAMNGKDTELSGADRA